MAVCAKINMKKNVYIEKRDKEADMKERERVSERERAKADKRN
jgi:hypothetical protein